MGDDDTVDENQNRARNEGADRNTFERDALRFAEIVDEYQRGNGQQVEDVQHQNRSCIEQCAVRQLIAYLGVAERYQQGNHIHGQSDEQRPCKNKDVLRQDAARNPAAEYRRRAPAEMERTGNDLTKCFTRENSFRQKWRKAYAFRQDGLCALFAHSPGHKGTHTRAAVHTHTAAIHTVHSAHDRFSFQFIINPIGFR